jgi:SAM-dependent methyltransferase
VLALLLIAAAAIAAVEGVELTAAVLLAPLAVMLVPAGRRLMLRLAVAAGHLAGSRIAGEHRTIEPAALGGLAQGRCFAVALATSVAAWTLPAAGLWALASSWGHAIGVVGSELAYARSTLVSGLYLAPAGVLVVGGRIIDVLQARGLAPADAATTVFAIRVATAGLSTALGMAFVLLHLRTRSAAASHFDEIAHAYDVQIPEWRRVALLERKTALMAPCLTPGARGLDIGCGQGWYIARMRALGFDTGGIDDSAAQIGRARRHVGDERVVRQGSVLELPAGDGTLAFAYTINVLHHLPSVEDQRRAFAEIARALEPGGVLFLHEINTRNQLFRFYMGYVFPSLNCIDEGVERWLLPHRLDTYTDLKVERVEYFTFLPEFLPASVVRLLRPIERLLERSPLRPYSAHYMAVLRKPA